MNAFSEFLHQQVPSRSRDIPGYYRRALLASETVLAVYFLIHIGLFWWAGGRWAWAFLVLLGAVAFCVIGARVLHPQIGLAIYAGITLLWCGGYIHIFGWGCGGQHLLIPLLVLCFFNIYIPPWRKILYFVGLVSYRMLLYLWTLQMEPVRVLTRGQSMVFQTANSLTLFIILALDCILLSSSLQETERKLRLDNEELSHEAETDPLTGLPNRRAMLNEISTWCRLNPNAAFCIAIADLDFFKKVNDTYGHLCGDYTLQQLTALFLRRAEGKYQVCRWGGEEFCFFLPGLNLDEGGSIMNDLCQDVSQMELNFEDHAFRITITIGVEENDFHSPLDALLSSADHKLYMGKEAGRNRVVM